jgi:hypothetical protein
LDDLNSDQENQAIEQEISATPEKGTFVSSEQAKDVAEAFFSRQNGGATAKSSLKAFASVSIETVKDNGNPLMYVINYPEGGWAIISATRNY